MADGITSAKLREAAPRPLSDGGGCRAGQDISCGEEKLVGVRLRALRRGQDLSIHSLAARCGISTNTLSLVENNRTSPSLHTLHLLADGLRVPLAALFEAEKPDAGLVYQQYGKRSIVQFDHGQLEKLGEGLPPLGAEPILVTLEKKHKNTAEITHFGREFIYCLEGKMTCIIAGLPYLLLPGDSLLFDAKAPHRWVNSDHEPSKLLVLFCPMEARDQPVERHLDY